MLGIFKKKVAASDVKVNSFGEPLYNLVDGDLPWGWVTHYSDFTKKIGEEFDYFRQAWFDAKALGDPRKEMDALKSFLQYMDDVQKFCNQQGECFGFWCSDYLIGRQKRNCQAKLAEIEKYMDNLIEIYNFQQSCNRETLLDIIKSEGGTILQTDLYKYFSNVPEIKEYIRNILYGMEAEGLIEKAKSGRTSILTIKE